jgi:DNA-binding PadR family transcriptional regulator
MSALSPEYALLGFLTQKSAHGYELHQRLIHELGQIWHISLSQTYNILNRLEAQGFVAGEVQALEKLPTRRMFLLTPAGRQRFETWLQAPSGSSVRAIRVEFTTRLYFTHASNPVMADQMIAAQIAETGAGLDRLQTTLAEIPEEQIFNRLGLELRIRQLTSILGWLSECRQALRSTPNHRSSM